MPGISVEELLLKIYPADLLGTMKTFRDTVEVCVPYKGDSDSFLFFTGELSKPT